MFLAYERMFRRGIRSVDKDLSSINYEWIENCRNDQYKKFSVFEGLQEGSKQKSVAFMVYDLAIG